jgi:hypothetical protein
MVLVISSTITTAQIPNNGFETWTTVGNYSMPDQWDNLNPSTAAAGIFTCIKGTPGSPGNSYLKLVSKTVTGMGVVPGIATCGVLDQVTHLPVSGFSFTQRPQNFTGKWQYMVYGAGAGYIDIILTRWDIPSNTRITVASTHKVLPGMVMSWANFSIPLTYVDGQFPDTCMIFLSASGSAPNNQDFLYLDNLQFTGTIAGVETALSPASALTVYPNPARGSFTARFFSSRTEQLAFQLLNLNGLIVSEQKVAVTSGENTIPFEIKSLPAGIYFLRQGYDSSLNGVRVVVK